MAKQNIKDFYGRVIGSIEDVGDRVIARDFYNKTLGSYVKAKDKTFDFYGRVISSGDTTVGLIYKEMK